MADIFISYAREDRSRIEPLAKSLEDLGWTVFWDRTIPAGKTWRQIIGDALKNARSVIVAWSKDSIESDWVQEEADRGCRRNILIPVLIDTVEPPLGFGAIQAADLSSWNFAQSSPEFEKLISDISVILGPSPRHVKEAEQAAQEDRKRKEAENKDRQARKGQIEREDKIPKPSAPEPATAELSKAIEPPDRAKAPPSPKSPAAKMGLIVAVAVVVVAGVMLLLRQEERKPIVKTSEPKVQVSSTPPAAPAVKLEPPVASKPSETSPSKKFTNSISMEFVLIPPGSFTMGSSNCEEDERPPHKVKILKPFYLQTTEVRQGQWEKVMGDNPSFFKACGDGCPVEQVSWEDVQRFIDKLNLLEKTKVYRLPTEAEWEYACRAGTTTEYSFGDDPSKLDNYGWYNGNSRGTTNRTATKTANPWGVYDMLGNVYELVEDDFHSDYNRAPSDGRAWIDNPRGSNRIIRGGSWVGDYRFCRSAKREVNWHDLRCDYVGFRLAMSIPNTP